LTFFEALNLLILIGSDLPRKFGKLEVVACGNFGFRRLVDPVQVSSIKRMAAN
jgi:hypothetical protein